MRDDCKWRSHVAFPTHRLHTSFLCPDFYILLPCLSPPTSASLRRHPPSLPPSLPLSLSILWLPSSLSLSGSHTLSCGTSAGLRGLASLQCVGGDGRGRARHLRAMRWKNGAPGETRLPGAWMLRSSVYVLAFGWLRCTLKFNGLVLRWVACYVIEGASRNGCAHARWVCLRVRLSGCLLVVCICETFCKIWHCIGAWTNVN